MESRRMAEQWRTACRRQAAAQAQQEAHTVWKLKAGQPLPFNHRWEHVQEVVELALWLAKLTNADFEVVEAAAWLHDVCKELPKHAIAGALEAERILTATDFPTQKIVLVSQAIRQHEGLKRPTGAPPLHPLEAAILWDADKLSKIGVQALAYLLSTGYLAGHTLTERRRYCQEYVEHKLEHTVMSMNTVPARRLAQHRYREMLAVVEMWAQEEKLVL
jgi:uncharacterized protein